MHKDLGKGCVVPRPIGETIHQNSIVELPVFDQRGLGFLRIAMASGVRPVGTPQHAVGIGGDERFCDRRRVREVRLFFDIR